MMRMFKDFLFISLLLIFSCNSKLKIAPQILIQNTLESKQNTLITQTNTINDNLKSFYEIDGPCSSNICPAPHGYCSSANSCKCANGYSNSQINQKSGIYCQYKQKKQLVAFLLEFFLSCGIGHLYAGRMIIGILKLVFALSFCIFYGYLKYKLNKESKQSLFMSNNTEIDVEESSSDYLEKLIGVSFVLICCGLFAWQITDLVFFGMNNYYDGNSIPLQKW